MASTSLTGTNTSTKGYGFGPPKGAVPTHTGASPLVTKAPLTVLQIQHIKQQIVGLTGHIAFLQTRLGRLTQDLSFMDQALVNSVPVPGYPPTK